MCRPYGWVFGVRNSLNKGPFSEDFPKIWVGLAEIYTTLLNVDIFPQRFIIKVGMKVSLGNKKRVPP